MAEYIRDQGGNTSFWEGVLAGTQDPWERLKTNDINGQMVQTRITYS